MTQVERMISIESQDGQRFDALFVPGAPGARAVILIQEIFGINDNMRHTALRIAQEGYAVCVPDLFWRLERGVALDPAGEQDRARAMQLNQAFDQARGVEDLRATLSFLRHDHPRVGTIGFCLGGRLAYLMAARSDADCNVGFYAVAIDKALDESSAIARPLLLHVAANDHLCPSGAQAQIAHVLGPHPQVTLHTYAGVGHAFARVGAHSYDAAAAELAWKRTYQFLHVHLAG